MKRYVIALPIMPVGPAMQAACSEAIKKAGCKPETSNTLDVRFHAKADSKSREGDGFSNFEFYKKEYGEAWEPLMQAGKYLLDVRPVLVVLDGRGVNRSVAVARGIATLAGAELLTPVVQQNPGDLDWLKKITEEL